MTIILHDRDTVNYDISIPWNGEILLKFVWACGMYYVTITMQIEKYKLIN